MPLPSWFGFFTSLTSPIPVDLDMGIMRSLFRTRKLKNRWHTSGHDRPDQLLAASSSWPLWRRRRQTRLPTSCSSPAPPASLVPRFPRKIWFHVFRLRLGFVGLGLRCAVQVSVDFGAAYDRVPHPDVGMEESVAEVRMQCCFLVWVGVGRRHLGRNY